MDTMRNQRTPTAVIGRVCVFSCFVLSFTAISCDGTKNRLVREDRLDERKVEVSPSLFVPYAEHQTVWRPKHKSFAAVHVLDQEKEEFYQRDTTILEVTWKGENLHWAGFGIPISIRSFEDRLYLIVFDRETDYVRKRFRYFRQDAGGFREIPPAEYPKEIATQNLWLKETDGFEADGKTPIYPRKIARELDPGDAHFRRSLTAEIWHQLETGKEYYENLDNTIGEDFLRAYLKKYDVQRLDGPSADAVPGGPTGVGVGGSGGY